MATHRLKFIITVIAVITAITSTSAQISSDTKDIQIAKQKLQIGTDATKYFSSILETISGAATHRQSPTAKAVYDYIQSLNIIVDGSTAAGDLDGTYPSPTVDGLQNRPVASTAPSSGDVLKWSGTAWEPDTDGGADGNGIYDGSGNVPDATVATLDGDFSIDDPTGTGKFFGQIGSVGGSVWNFAGDSTLFRYFDAAGNNEISLKAGGIYFRTTGTGDRVYFENRDARYDADYSGSYSSRSLVDKAYVDGLIPNISAANGLTESPTNTVILGGSLTGNTTITTTGFSLTATGANGSTPTLNVVNSSTGNALTASSAGGSNYTATVTNTSTGPAFHGLALSGGVGGVLTSLHSSTNTVRSIAYLQRETSGTAADGIGGSLDFNIEMSDGNLIAANKITSKLTTALAGSNVSQMIFSGVNTSAANILTLNGNQSIILNGYGSGTFTGTPAYALQVDASGNVIEGAVSAGLSDADYGDITVSGGGTVMDIDAGVVTPTEVSSDVIVNGGNTDGGAITIGTNDAFALNLETNNVARAVITGGASTGGAWTVTDVTANTNTVETSKTSIVNSSGTAATGLGMRHLHQLESSTTNAQDAASMDVLWSDGTHASRTADIVFSTVAGAAALAEAFRIGGTTYALTATASVAATNTVADRFIIKTNSSGTAATNFGAGIFFQGESSTTDNQDMIRISSIWRDATHASRASSLVISAVSGAGAIGEVARFGTANGSMSLAGGNTTYANNGINVSGTTFTIGNGTQSVSLTSSGGSQTAILLNNTNTGTGCGGTFGNTTTTGTSGTRNAWRFSDGFAPTSGTAVFYNASFNATINQTGGANGLTGAIILEPTLTAVGATWSGITMATSNTSAKFLNQTGANTTSTHVGAFGFGSTTVPTDKLEVTGNLALLAAGNKLKIATGSNASMGTATLVGGTVTVNTTAVATGSTIFLTCNTPGGTQGFLSAPAASITNATSFVINSSNGADTSTVNWWIIN